MRTNNRVVLDKDSTGLSEILYALRSAPKNNKTFPADSLLGRKLSTVKEIITTKPYTNNYNVSENDSIFDLERSDFPRVQDSEIRVRERAHGSKLESAYKWKMGRITDETSHTVTMQESGKATQKKVYSKRDIARAPKNLVQNNSKSEHSIKDKPTNSAQPKRGEEHKNSKRKKEKKIPEEFKRLANWRDLLESDDEDEIRKRPIKIK